MKLCFFKYNFKDTAYEWIDVARVNMWIKMI